MTRPFDDSWCRLEDRWSKPERELIDRVRFHEYVRTISVAHFWADQYEFHVHVTFRRELDVMGMQNVNSASVSLGPALAQLLVELDAAYVVERCR